MHRIPYFMDKTIYNPSEISKVLKLAVNEDMLHGDNKGRYYYNVPCAFDIEATSFYVDNDCVVDYNAKRERQKAGDTNYNPERRACMYVWQFGINGRVIIGRTWPEFVEMLNFIAKTLQLNENKRLIIYVHNLSYEFQFLRKWLDWQDEMLSIDVRRPLYAVTSHYIEFRCSYLLTGYSLANLCKQMQKFKIKKLTGNLDYSILHSSASELSDEEIAYCVNDVLIIMCYIQEKIDEEGGIANIPLTQTGYVRRYCRQCTLYIKGHRRNEHYYKIIHGLNFADMEEFRLVHDCFQGGFTHANSYYSGMTLENVASYDFTSSYPYIMVSEKFPMSSGLKVEIKDKSTFDFYLNNYACIMDVEFYGLIQRETHEHPLSVSKCKPISEDKVVDNGRVVSCSYCRTRITGIDFLTYKHFYQWKNIVIKTFYIYHCQYLPTELVMSILDLYARKTTLKGVKGSEVEYMRSKEMINSVYGMCVTNPLRDEIYIDENDEWQVRELEEFEMLDMLFEHNEKKNRFLFYLWGVFVTAYARKNLFTAIKRLEWDYVYSDTDSVKVLHHERHKDYFDAYNEHVRQMLNKAAKYHGINPAMFSPRTIEGVEKMLGVWDYEGMYRRFKTLGAKRYCVEFADESDYITIDGIKYPISITVAGLNKYHAIPYIFRDLAHGNSERVFDYFVDGLHIPPEHTGKLLQSYIDDEIEGTFIDYQGHVSTYHEKSCTHMENTSYDLSLARLYVEYLRGNRDIIM